MGVTSSVPCNVVTMSGTEVISFVAWIMSTVTVIGVTSSVPRNTAAMSGTGVRSFLHWNIATLSET